MLVSGSSFSVVQHDVNIGGSEAAAYLARRGTLYERRYRSHIRGCHSDCVADRVTDLWILRMRWKCGGRRGIYCMCSLERSWGPLFAGGVEQSSGAEQRSGIPLQHTTYGAVTGQNTAAGR